MKKVGPEYKVCILAAGMGSRLGAYSEHIHKAILPVNNKAVISYVIEKFPVDVEIVVAVGHKKDTVVDYLILAYPERTFKFVVVDKFAGPGSGPGYSLLACKKYLQCPFVFATADTIVLEEVPLPDKNWIGIAPVHDTESYCTVKIRNNAVYQLDVKIKTDNHFAFIGLAGIRDYKEFFEAIENDKELVAQEMQMTSGLKGLLERHVAPIGFTWFDTGTLENYIETDKNFSGEGKFDFSKGNEFLYFVNNRVIKFFADKTITDKRHTRSKRELKGITPQIEGKRGHFYAYKKVEGQTMYSVLSVQLTEDFLKWAKTHLWKKLKLSKAQAKKFEEASIKFYRDKTKERLLAYEKKYGNETHEKVNGIKIPSVGELLKKVDWDYVAKGEPHVFHGDLQFDNVLVKTKPKSGKEKFLLLDWRHDFGGLVEAGDLYYDLAKLYGGMTLSYPLIKEGMFHVGEGENEAYYHYFVKSDLLDAKEYFEEFVQKNGYDLEKVKLLTSLIFLNMAPLHHDPFDKMLYHMGRKMLHKTIEKSQEKR